MFYQFLYKLVKSKMYSLYFDGASKHNPGHAACGAVLYDDNDTEVDYDSKYLGDKVSNNYAEYTGLIVGLHLALKNNITEISVYGDSLLVINQMRTIWKVKNDTLIKLYGDANKLIKCLDKIKFIHIKRDKNKRADELANKELKMI
tara:strand:- start:126 stop:563 length:438 start_codon:yes stop_codon:yes gene_type:complete